jgi:peroxiredoxin
MAKVTSGGNAVTVRGDPMRKGYAAPEFSLAGNDLKDIGLRC